jgi:hypothetical protein
VTPEALEAALEATMLANEQAIAAGEVPDLTDAIRRGVRWKPEPFADGEHFDLAHQVAARGWGDCDDLAPWLAAQLRASGEDPGARPRVYQSGPNRWHVVTETSDGQILDPSKWAGMGRKSARVTGVVGAIAKPFARPDNGGLVVMPHGGKFWARCDLPWPDGSGHLASHARARHPDDALDRAIAGALACGEMIDSPLTDRLQAAGEFLLSDRDEVGSLFGKIFKGIKSVAKSALPMAASLIPGGGIATSALSALTKGGGKRPKGAPQHPSGAVSVPLEQAAPKGHGQHMMLYYHPERAPGPVVMRF